VNRPNQEFTMSALTFPDPIAAYFAADTQRPDIDDLRLSFRLERGLISSLEITV